MKESSWREISTFAPAGQSKRAGIVCALVADAEVTGVGEGCLLSSGTRPPPPPTPPCPPGPLSCQESIATGLTYGGAEGA